MVVTATFQSLFSRTESTRRCEIYTGRPQHKQQPARENPSNVLKSESVAVGKDAGAEHISQRCVVGAKGFDDMPRLFERGGVRSRNRPSEPRQNGPKRLMSSSVHVHDTTSFRSLVSIVSTSPALPPTHSTHPHILSPSPAHLVVATPTSPMCAHRRPRYSAPAPETAFSANRLADPRNDREDATRRRTIRTMHNRMRKIIHLNSMSLFVLCSYTVPFSD